jgi:beta-glucosidase
VKELKGFSRVALKRGASKTVTIPLRRADLCHWDEAAKAWMLEPGEMTVLVGGSSAQLPLNVTKIIK